MTGIPPWSVSRRAALPLQSRSGPVPCSGLAFILLAEPAGLSIGKVKLADGRTVLGVLGEPVLCTGQREITPHKGWRAYTATI